MAKAVKKTKPTVKTVKRVSAAKKAKPAAKPVAKPVAKAKKPVGRQVAMQSRRSGTVSVVQVQTKPAVVAPPPPPAPPALPIVLTGSPLEISRKFYDAHGLQAFSAALPATLDSAAFEATAREQGMQRVLVFPPVRIQRAAIELMVKALLTARSPALESSQQYTAPWLFDLRALYTSEAHGRPEGAYLQAITDGAYNEDTRDRKASQLDGRLAALSHCSLTFFEYMVWQRLFAEERQDHRFDQQEIAHGHPPGWQWLLDTRIERGAVHASWNEDKRRVEVGLINPGNFSSKRGVHFTDVKAI